MGWVPPPPPVRHYGDVAMQRLCERPGCSDPASVSYGMRPADLVFWLDSLSDGDDPSHGVLCRRHADSMVVPRNWTLDDLRDPDLHLFRPPTAHRASRPARRAAPRRAVADQLALGIDLDGPAPVPVDRSADAIEPVEPVEPADRPPGSAPDPEAPDPWTPTFDNADDLDGLLAARSPLLARAFRGADRPRPS